MQIKVTKSQEKKDWNLKSKKKPLVQCLDPVVAESVQLDHSHFSLQSKPPVCLILAKKFV
jgi:hypothetical protein